MAAHMIIRTRFCIEKLYEAAGTEFEAESEEEFVELCNKLLCLEDYAVALSCLDFLWGSDLCLDQVLQKSSSSNSPGRLLEQYHRLAEFYVGIVLATASNSLEDALEKVSFPIFSFLKRVPAAFRAHPDIWLQNTQTLLSIAREMLSKKCFVVAKKALRLVTYPPIAADDRLGAVRATEWHYRGVIGMASPGQQLQACRAFLNAVAFLRGIENDPSQMGTRSESMSKTCLVSAAVCCIMADAGPARSQLLSRLTSSTYICSFNASLQSVLLTAVQRRTLTVPVVAAALQDACAVIGAAPPEEHVVAKAVCQHNIAEAACMYVSISLSSLAALANLGAEDAAAEIVATMSIEGRLNARIDLVDGMVYFSGHSTSKEYQDRCRRDALLMLSDAADLVTVVRCRRNLS